MRKKPARTDTQDNYVKRLQSTLDKLERPFERPSKPVYRGQSNIIVAVSIGLQSSLTAIAVDVISQQVLTYRSTRQLLGDNYLLFNRQQNLQRQQRQLNHKAQKQGRMNRLRKSHCLPTQIGQPDSLRIPHLENRIEILLIAPR